MTRKFIPLPEVVTLLQTSRINQFNGLEPGVASQVGGGGVGFEYSQEKMNNKLCNP